MYIYIYTVGIFYISHYDLNKSESALVESLMKDDPMLRVSM